MNTHGGRSTLTIGALIRSKGLGGGLTCGLRFAILVAPQSGGRHLGGTPLFCDGDLLNRRRAAADSDGHGDSFLGANVRWLDSQAAGNGVWGIVCGDLAFETPSSR